MICPECGHDGNFHEKEAGCMYETNDRYCDCDLTLGDVEHIVVKRERDAWQNEALAARRLLAAIMPMAPWDDEDRIEQETAEKEWRAARVPETSGESSKESNA